MQIILGGMMTTVQEIGNFALLLLVLVFIYSLVGQQLFANRMRFDASSGVRLGLSDPEYANADVPRSNYDTMSLSMITTFQVLTGEDWNVVMYNGWRATSFSWVAILYYVSLIVIGVFVIMNIFLGVLLHKFEDLSLYDDDDDVEGEQEEQEESKGGSAHRSATCRRSLGEGVGWLRKRCQQVVGARHFDSAMTFLVICSCICLALDNPLSDPRSLLSRILNGLDITFTALYTVELLLKVLAHGLIVGKHSYLRDPWNMMDLCVVITSILNLADIGPGNALRVLRLFRILRALRMIRRFPQLKIVVDALLLSLPSVANVALLCALFFLVFSLLGVGLLKGTFMRCSGEAFDALTASQKQYLTNPSMS